MLPQNKKVKIILLLFFVPVLIFGFFLYSQEVTDEYLGVDISLLDNKDAEGFWLQDIKNRGGADSYKNFGEVYKDFTIAQKHNQAHIFGGALYAIEGNKGISVCDGNYNFGCFHEFLGQAMFNQGIEVVEELNDLCQSELKDQALGCQHGIGHGIQTTLGYEHQNLEEALEHCKVLPFNDPIGGCYGGVFMEYNMRTMLNNDGVGNREFDGKLHGPCDTLPYEYKDACYYWQVDWWRVVFDGEGISQMAKKMGDLCVETGDEYLTKKCFEGLGNISVSVDNYNPDSSREMCEASSEDPQLQLYCKADAAGSFWAVPARRNRAAEVCEGLSDEGFKYCTDNANNIHIQ